MEISLKVPRTEVMNPMNVLMGYDRAEPQYIHMDSWGKLKESEIEHIVLDRREPAGRR